MTLLLSGCATITLPQGPDVYSFAQRPNAPIILVARATDQRADKQKLGKIGALSLSMKADPAELVGKEVVTALYEQGFNGRLEPISSDQMDGFAAAAQRVNAAGVLALSIQSISIQSFDAIMDPPTAELVLQATLYDRQGNLVGSSSVTGHIQKRINTFATEKNAGQLVGETARDAAQRLVGRGGMADTLQKLVMKETPPREETPPETSTPQEEGASAPQPETTQEAE